MRGNQRQARRGATPRRSIPARAGEPQSAIASHSRSQVYPRACGGTCPLPRVSRHSNGLSPRVRGNPSFPRAPAFFHGSIPARAGEPLASRSNSSLSRVYPRACGGTHYRRQRESVAIGLSPRVRGNQAAAPVRSRLSRSIPARAGEPKEARARLGHSRVYPRACGGTVRPGPSGLLVRGLSPRVRGNHTGSPRGYRPARSIPARAGEPWPIVIVFCPRWVYPRACGGTVSRFSLAAMAGGLSPRVRGNHPSSALRRRFVRSIPARAGEPPMAASCSSCHRVYPRACGGTTWGINTSLT